MKVIHCQYMSENCLHPAARGSLGKVGLVRSLQPHAGPFPVNKNLVQAVLVLTGFA